MKRTPRPLPGADALKRMLSLVGDQHCYVLGTGDYRPGFIPDVPWTTRAEDGRVGSDCAGAAMSWAFKIPRHRPGLNHGSWATVSDDLNTNSGIEDAEHEQDLFRLVDPATEQLLPGDLLAYPTIQLRDQSGDWMRWPNGSIRQWIGHVQMIVAVPPGWTTAQGWSPLKVVDCHGGDGRSPAITLLTAYAMDNHDHTWPLPEHRTRVLRSVP
jgi:hypothetical protein